MIVSGNNPQTLLFLSIIVKVPHLSEVIHLGQCLNEDIYIFSSNKCVNINQQYVFCQLFKYVNPYVRNVLFKYFQFL